MNIGLAALWFAVPLVLSVAAFPSCAGAERVETTTVPPDARLRMDVLEAVDRAHRLEEIFWQDATRFPDRDALFHHYRSGFSEELARNLTEYTWPNGHSAPRPGDVTLLPPETLHFLEIDETYALAYFEAAEEMRELWEHERYVLLRIERENDRWIIVESQTLPEPPGGE